MFGRRRKKASTDLLQKKKYQGLILWDTQHLLRGTELLQFLLTSAEAARHVPGSDLQGLLVAGASISISSPQCLQETSQSAHGVRGDSASPLVPRRAPWAESASHIALCWVMHEEGGQEVLRDDSYCALETWAGRVVSFPVYLFTPSFPVTVQGTSMFREMYLWKKNDLFWRQLPGFLIPAKNLCISYLQIFLDQLISQQGMETFLEVWGERNVEGPCFCTAFNSCQP